MEHRRIKGDARKHCSINISDTFTVLNHSKKSMDSFISFFSVSSIFPGPQPEPEPSTPIDTDADGGSGGGNSGSKGCIVA
jgi:hypothetical protein